MAVLTGMLLHGSAAAREGNADSYDKLKTLERIWVFDGTGVHNVGNLHMHVTNWGCFGSYPGGTAITAQYPSAQWPANSGVEYLYIAGLWIGARRGGVPVVSTGAYEIEFQPDPDDPLNKIYTAFEGIVGGNRLPGDPDDDRDGLWDEDWLNGVDDDGDGLIDEDFAAISNQMFVTWYRDDMPAAMQRYPDHTPLNLHVRQESYQWEDPLYYDFVGVDYWITNMGRNVHEEVYIGFFADGDAGPLDKEQYWMDDCTGYYSGIQCAPRGDFEVPVPISVAYFYDSDGDDGRTLGYFGILFLGHDVDPLGENAPRRVGITCYKNFSGDAPFEAGGDPTNDYQRYQLMSSTTFSRNQEAPRDYRMLMATGPFREFPPDSTMRLQVAFVIGEGLEGMLRTAARAVMAYQGNWFDVDGNPLTGVDGRETPIPGPVSNIVADSCAAEETGDFELVSAARGEVVWINADCREELMLWEYPECRKGTATFEDFQTGVHGRETQVKWLVGSAPPPPNMRVVPGDGKVTLFWDNLSEVTPDVSTQELDFEGYRIWRADGWKRPLGTSVLTGPARDMWQLLEEGDLDNNVPPNNLFKAPWPDGWEYEPLGNVAEKDQIIAYFTENLYQFPFDKVPCPVGLTELECDTIEALARYRLGFEGGLQYYKYVDYNVHNGRHYFYAVTAYDHVIAEGVPLRPGMYGDPSSNFQYVVPIADALDEREYESGEVYVVPNPATKESMAPWALHPNMEDPTGIKVEFRNLPRTSCTVRIYTISGDLVEVLHHNGATQDRPLFWDLVSRNGQEVTSGVYLFAVTADDNRFKSKVGKFVVIR